MGFFSFVFWWGFLVCFGLFVCFKKQFLCLYTYIKILLFYSFLCDKGKMKQSKKKKKNLKLYHFNPHEFLSRSMFLISFSSLCSFIHVEEFVTARQGGPSRWSLYLLERALFYLCLEMHMVDK